MTKLQETNNMGIRLPKANTAFQTYTNSDLANQGQNVVTSLTGNANFATPPIPIVSLQALVNQYNAALAASIHGSKEQRAEMHEQRFQLRNGLRITANYVNESIYNSISSGTTYEAAKVLILSTGFALSLDPSPIGTLPQPEVIRFSSPARGQLYILIKKIKGARTYNLIIGLTGTSEATWKTYPFPNTRILKTGLTPGQSYTFKLYPTGANGSVTTETDPMTQVII